MAIQEQEELKKKYYGEAIRYMDNAKECLQKAQKEGKYYNDPKYVKMACGTAYNGLLTALDGFLTLKNIELPKGKDRKSTVSERSRTIEFYHNNLAKIDKKMLKTLNSAYQILHLSGYYDGILNVNVIKEGFDNAYTLIKKIKPADHTINGT